MKTKRRHFFQAASLAAFACSGTVHALTPDFFGYVRTGIGTNNKGGDQVCFGLPGAGAKWRLGNECETYGELGLGADLYEADGVKFNYKLMLDYFGGTNAGDEQNLTFDDNNRRIGLRQNYISLTGLGSGFMQDASIWFGKRYYQRHDVHAMDFFYWNNSGNGLGIEGMNFGIGKVSAAIIRVDATTARDVSDKGRTGTTFDLRLAGVPLNPNGELEFGFDFRWADQQESATVEDKDGYLFTVEHTQKDLWNGFNKVAFQYGDDAGGRGGGNTPFSFTNIDQRFWRIVEHLVIQPMSDLSIMIAGVYEERKAGGTDYQKWTSIGARPTYNWTKYIASAAELSYDTVKYTDLIGVPAATGQTGKLTKLTIVPLVLRPGNAPFARPELRLFATFARWNDAANAAAGGNLVNEVDFVGSDAKSGRTFGAQLEAWW